MPHVTNKPKKVDPNTLPQVAKLAPLKNQIT